MQSVWGAIETIQQANATTRHGSTTTARLTLWHDSTTIATILPEHYYPKTLSERAATLSSTHQEM
ncbi:uncharacterized protein CANTADRAFT_24321 [Suhomyces tanzawaensis NRRL Y-17324]|uniref:Uncharacterized protein n=1 Tax=Suhomyces tanzawaensis NRRL Y-17324 TaxID=984487 RepID=A0A1E4SPC9_9ASCO|nr:uncharacterized protein CANTADRAFT_24321 [Suhomyces tanzawaensis NRRL Y-17324]ODV81346.1 hypothetical protein CANTADRAFT_24321 [Suhomyces tanzawaensis NRRL Y-17324]